MQCTNHKAKRQPLTGFPWGGIAILVVSCQTKLASFTYNGPFLSGALPLSQNEFDLREMNVQVKHILTKTRSDPEAKGNSKKDYLAQHNSTVQSLNLVLKFRA